MLHFPRLLSPHPWRQLTIAVGLAAVVSTQLQAQQPTPAPGAAAGSRPRIGLALGGGSARGLAHIGLLAWFEEHRIPIDVMAGTSMGGLVGGAYASGLSPDEIRGLLAEADWKLIFQGGAPFSDKNFRRRQDDRAFPSKLHFGLRGGLKLPSGLNEGQQVDLLLDAITVQYSELATFDDLPTPFRCVAADLVSARPVTFKDGSLSSALRATMSLPGVFIPVRNTDQVLVDGGIFNNVPADVVRAMGADVVIAVSVGGSDVAGTKTAAPTYSMFAVLGNMIDAMMSGNTARGLTHADLVIRPAVDDVSSMEFHNTAEIAALGYAAAEARSAELLPYAVDEATYAEFRAARDGRRRRVEIVPRSIEVTGVPEVTQATIRGYLGSHLNVPLDVVRLARDITRLGGSDRFETIGYRVVTGADGPVLKLAVQPKPYGPPFLALGVDVSNPFGTNLQLGLGSRLTAYDVFFLGYGSEARFDLGVGSGLEARGELYRPLGRSPWFAAASAGVVQSNTPVFTGREAVAEYRLTRTGGGVDIGYNTGYRSEVRFGYQAANIQASVRVGDPILPELEGGERLLRLQAIFDDQDSPMIPSRGLYARGRLNHILDAATVTSTAADMVTSAEDAPFTTAEVAANWFKEIGSRWRLLAAADGGTAFGREPLPPNNFSLGGPFRFGAYNVGEIRTSDFLIGSGGILREFGRLPEVLGGGVFGGAWLEAGSAFDGEGFRTNLSTALVIETLLGPLFGGASVGFDGRTRIYIGMGRLFQRGVR